LVHVEGDVWLRPQEGRRVTAEKGRRRAWRPLQR
jgi:hypothetical protein